jgi:hypothetical protein
VYLTGQAATCNRGHGAKFARNARTMTLYRLIPDLAPRRLIEPRLRCPGACRSLVTACPSGPSAGLVSPRAVWRSAPLGG